MKALLDEGVPKKLARLLQERGQAVSAFLNPWKGVTNGRLIAEAHAAGFDTLVTCDKNLRHQQTIRDLALLILPSQNLTHLLAIVDEIAVALEQLDKTPLIVLDRQGQASQQFGSDRS